VIIWVWLVAPSDFSGSKPSWACFAEHPDRKSARLANADAETARITRFESKIDPSDIESLRFNPTLQQWLTWLIQAKIEGFCAPDMEKAPSFKNLNLGAIQKTITFS
jgi:hypothetical protein